MIFRLKKVHSKIFLTIVSFISSFSISAAQAPSADTLLQRANLDALIDYALEHQPSVRQATLDQEITDLQIKNRLADWYPQLNFNYTYQRNFQLPVNIIGGNQVRFGVNNTSALQLTASQQIFNRDALLASRTKQDVREAAAKQTENLRINLVANVSKNFYDLLATEQQRKITEENIIMLSRSLKDARARYDVGVTDKTDYQRATIALNNAVASKREIEEALKAKTANIKYLINYPDERELTFEYDSAQLESEIFLDTTSTVSYTNRVEYQQLQAQLRLQQANVSYNKWSYIPSVAANGAYIRNFLNDDFAKLYNQGFPNSYAGLTLGFPIFQGGKRKNNIIIAEKQVQQTEWDLVNFKNQASSEYKTAMSQYRANLANYVALKENMELAREVHRIIELQYREGIKTYLELITAQTDLRSAQINYFNAVYGLLSSKIDVRKAEGAIRSE
ncbi:TolC family protein [Niabella insulamsoli]|uniref:TolC family protein n=1 Tax=Niabella insulamsoli TaxID=3144874 RepID=UPI0031FD7959